MISGMHHSDHSSVAIYIGEALAAYGFGADHPFGTDRMDAFWLRAQASGLAQGATVLAPVACSERDLLRFHTPAYVELVRRLSQGGVGYLDMGDTPAFVGIFEAASTVVGCAIDAAARIMAGQAARVFVPIAGLHHARRDGAAGFCVFNDCGILIEYLKAEHRLTRIAYVDIDAHHGDGVFYAFESDPAVWIADLHEDGRFLYPGTGRADESGTGGAVGTKLNLPLPPGADDAAFLNAWEAVEAHLERANPELIIFQCGADSVAGDPITHLQCSPAMHAHAANRLRAIADEFANGRLIALGGGGYNRDNLAEAWCKVLAQLE